MIKKTSGENERKNILYNKYNRNDTNGYRDWEVIKVEDFEYSWPNDWDVYATSGYTDAYWNVELQNSSLYVPLSTLYAFILSRHGPLHDGSIITIEEH